MSCLGKETGTHNGATELDEVALVLHFFSEEVGGVELARDVAGRDFTELDTVADAAFTEYPCGAGFW